MGKKIVGSKPINAAVPHCALGRIGAADAVPALIEVFPTDVNMRRSIAEALG